jgi:hypothetical protein
VRGQNSRYIGYWKPYATGHEELDRDVCVQEEVRGAAQTLIASVSSFPSGADNIRSDIFARSIIAA